VATLPDDEDIRSAIHSPDKRASSLRRNLPGLPVQQSVWKIRERLKQPMQRLKQLMLG